MKRAISIFFIVLASVAILAHAVVPHHHHNKLFAAVVNILDEHSQERLRHSHVAGSHHHQQRHSHDATSHHHHSSGGSEDCLINEACVGAIRFTQGGDENLVPESYNSDFQLDLASLIADLFAPDFSGLSVPYPFPPYIESVHLRHIARCAGLRAPPVC